MSQAQVEQNILNAVKVVRHVHKETNALIASLDGALADRGWQSLNKNWLGLWKTGAGLDAPDNWMATVLNRAYANVADPRRVILFEVYLAPPDGGPPVVAMAALSLALELPANKLWAEEGWHWQQPRPWFDSVEELNTESLRRVVPKALHGRGRLVPLCSLDKTTLVELVVEPILALVRSVPLE